MSRQPQTADEWAHPADVDPAGIDDSSGGGP